uniref:Uncharacterized protein n=1 Tax=Arundo donax TaxID=35708 RepID=A0A0A9R035_ARUDO
MGASSRRTRWRKRKAIAKGGDSECHHLNGYHLPPLLTCSNCKEAGSFWICPCQAGMERLNFCLIRSNQLLTIQTDKSLPDARRWARGKPCLCLGRRETADGIAF